MNVSPLVSRSEKRFLVTFHMMKATMPITAMPPATESPMMVPVLTPASGSSDGFPVFVLVGAVSVLLGVN
jgi:hypothetical protein